MADLVIDDAQVAVVEIIDAATHPTEVAVTKGQALHKDPTTGYWELADADAATPLECQAIAIKGAAAAGYAVTAISKGLIDLGDALDGLDIGAKIYPSGTPGGLADAQVGVQPAVGEVYPAYGNATQADKLLKVDIVAGGAV